MDNKYSKTNDFNIILFLLNNTHNNILDEKGNTILDEEGNNIIHLSVKNGIPSTLFHLLLELKKNKTIDKLINQRNDDGNTPLHLCFQNKNNTQELVEILLYFKANPKIPDLYGNIINKQIGGSNNIKVKGIRYI